MPTASEVFAKFEQLKTRHQAASQAHAVAQSQHAQAQSIVAKAEEQLRALGIDPEKAEAQLAQELSTLNADLDALDKELTARMDEYRAIGADFAKIGV